MVKKKKNIPPPIKQQSEIKKAPVVNNPPKIQVTTPSPSYRSKTTDNKSVDFVFGKTNYIIMIGGLVLIAFGYILMIGGGSDDPKVFNYDLFDAQRLTYSTILILLGFFAEVVAILKKPKAKSA